MVKHVFITSDLGEYNLPKWASWIRVIIDGLVSPAFISKQTIDAHLAEDLPLNVSRETPQSSAFLKQIRGIVVRRLIQLFTKIAEEDNDKFAEIQKVYHTILKLGTAEDEKNRQKIASLVRFSTNQRNSTSLDDVGVQFMWGAHFSLSCSTSRTRSKVRNRCVQRYQCS